MSAAKVRAAILSLCLCLCARPGFSRVHEVLWDVPSDGLQLASISTVKCGDVIRFRCPLHATHGIFKMEPTNYNGTCPTSFDAPLVGEVLSAPAKACDYSLTVGDGPDFFVTSQVAGACQKNLKVYVHATCIKNDNTYASGLLSALPSLPSLSSLPKMLPVSAGLLGGVPAGSGSSADAPTGLMTGSSAVLGGLMDSRPALGAANTGAMRAHPGLYSSEPGVLEQAKQSGAADVKPALFKAAAAAAAAAVLALAL